MEVRQSRLGPEDRKNEVACAEFEQVILLPSFKVYLFFFGHSKNFQKDIQRMSKCTQFLCLCLHFTTFTL